MKFALLLNPFPDVLGQRPLVNPLPVINFISEDCALISPSLYLCRRSERSRLQCGVYSTVLSQRNGRVYQINSKDQRIFTEALAPGPAVYERTLLLCRLNSFTVIGLCQQTACR